MDKNLNLYGVYPAVVVNTNDPKGKGRVSLRIASVLGSATSAWASPLGEINTPVKKGDAVLAQFIGGDVTQPVYSVSASSHPWSSTLFTEQNTVVGSVTVTPSAANTATFASITYSLPGFSNYWGTVTAHTTFPSNHTVFVSISGITASGASVYLMRGDTTATEIYYMVYGTP